MSSDEKDLLRRCTDQIEEKLQWGDSSGWSNSDYEDLSNKIFEKTQVKLSISTLKRIWGKVKYDNSFNKSTLNALVQFIGFENWRTFSGDCSIETIYSVSDSFERETSDNISKAHKLAKGLSRKTAQTFVLGFVGVLVVILFLFSFKKEPTPTKPINFAGATFEAKTTSDDLPNSVVFKYDVSSCGVDTAIIQQNWDPRRQEKISAKKSIHTSIYYYPGNFNARLIINNQVVKKDRVYIKTNGWKGIIEKEPVPIYLSEGEISQDGAIGIDGKTFKEKINSSVLNDRWVNFYNVKEFDGLKSNNFSLEAVLQNTSSVEESLCRKVNIYVLYDGGAIIIPLADKGCVSAIDLYTGVERVSGKDRDLSEFGCDFSKPQNLKCIVADRKLTITINDKYIFSSLMDIDEKIVGLCFSFEGGGKVNRVKLGEPGKFPVYFERL